MIMRERQVFISNLGEKRIKLSELENDIIKFTEKKLYETISYKNEYDRTNLKLNRTNLNDFKSIADTNLKTSYDDLMSSKGILLIIQKCRLKELIERINSVRRIKF